MKKYITLLTFTMLILSCDLSSEDSNGNTDSIPDQELSVEFSIIDSTGAIVSESYLFNEAYWDDNGIYFQNSTNPSQGKWVQINDVSILGSGQIGVMETPYALIAIENDTFTSGVFSTQTRPVFWVDGPNYNNLIVGGSGFSPSDYLDPNSGSVVQGGYLKVTNYNERYIAGECYIVGWAYSNQLNREVMWGVYVQFSGVEYQP